MQRPGCKAMASSPVRVHRRSPAFLIATSAGEVGVDLDADHMVCDLVPWERMVQRLGRVNRRGESDATIAVVDGDEPEPKKPDEPTEQERRQRVGFRSRAVFEELPNVGDGKDASPGALRELKLRAETDEVLRGKIAAATTPEPLRPALTRPLVDAWSMTALENHTGRPDIAPWLRGWVGEDRQTTLFGGHICRYVKAFPNGPVHRRRRGRSQTSSRRLRRIRARSSDRDISRRKLASGTRKCAAQARADAPKESAEGEDTGEAEASTAGAPDTDEPETEQTTPAKKLRRDDIVAFALSPGGDYGARYTLGGLAQERKSKSKDEFQDELVGKILVVDARFSGLKDGLLDVACDRFPDTADGSTEWGMQAQFRVRRPTSDDYESRDEDWRFEDGFVLRSDVNGDPEEWLVVEHYRDAAQREDARSISRPQELAEHQIGQSRGPEKLPRRSAFPASPLKHWRLRLPCTSRRQEGGRWQRRFQGAVRTPNWVRARRPAREDARAVDRVDPRRLSARVQVAAYVRRRP